MIEKLIRHLDFIIAHAEKTFPIISGNTNGAFSYYLKLSIDRIYQTSHALRALLYEYKANENVEYSIGIILRSCLLDAQLTVHLCMVIDEENLNEDEEIVSRLDPICDGYLSDGFEEVILALEREKSAGYIPNNELLNFYNDMVKQFSYFFQEYNGIGKPDLKPEIKESKDNIKHISRRLRGTTTRWKDVSIKIMTKYNTYSKYDHFTLLFYIFNRQERTKKDERIEDSVEYILLHYQLIHSLLLHTPEFNEEMELEKEAINYIKDNLDFSQ